MNQTLIPECHEPPHLGQRGEVGLIDRGLPLGRRLLPFHTLVTVKEVYGLGGRDLGFDCLVEVYSLGDRGWRIMV